MNEAKLFAAGYGVWVVVHSAAAVTYPWLCSGTTVLDVLASPFRTPAPHCRALLWCLNAGATGIDAMWAAGGAWALSRLARMPWMSRGGGDSAESSGGKGGN